MNSSPTGVCQNAADRRGVADDRDDRVLEPGVLDRAPEERQRVHAAGARVDDLARRGAPTRPGSPPSRGDDRSVKSTVPTLARRRTEVHRGLAAVRADLEQRPDPAAVEPRLVQRQALVLGHEPLGRARDRERLLGHRHRRGHLIGRPRPRPGGTRRAGRRRRTSPRSPPSRRSTATPSGAAFAAAKSDDRRRARAGRSPTRRAGTRRPRWHRAVSRSAISSAAIPFVYAAYAILSADAVPIWSSSTRASSADPANSAATVAGAGTGQVEARRAGRRAAAVRSLRRRPSARSAARSPARSRWRRRTRRRTRRRAPRRRRRPRARAGRSR